jgi:hypothetical protein
MLHRYWLVGSPQQPYGPSGLGVTAYSVADALALLRQVLPPLLGRSLSPWMGWTDERLRSAQVIADIDVSLLDKGHIIPNMGLVIDRGVWWPKTEHLH